MLNDGDIYNIYGNYSILYIVWQGDNHGTVRIKFPAVAMEQYQTIQLKEEIDIIFSVNENNVITLNKRLPEFVLKDVIDRIRKNQDDKDQYMWAV